MYLFGFGSLINLSSAQKSFQRELSYKDLIPVKVKGYKKVWNSIEYITFDDKEVNGVFLNLQEDKSSTTTGVVIKLSTEEFEVLKQREKNYSQIEIKAENIEGAFLEENAVAFMTTKTDKIAKVGDENTYIPAKYIEILTSAFENYDEEFVNSYKKECLENFPFELKEGVYKFADALQNKLAKEGIRK